MNEGDPDGKRMRLKGLELSGKLVRRGWQIAHGVQDGEEVKVRISKSQMARGEGLLSQR